MPDLADLVTTVEAAQMLGVDRSTLTRWASPRLRDEERFAPAASLGGQHFYLRRDVEALVTRRKAAAESADQALSA